MCSVSGQERGWQNDDTWCQAPWPTQRPSLRYRLLGSALRSTRHLPWDLPGLSDSTARKPSPEGQLLSELGSKSPSALQKNIFQTGLFLHDLNGCWMSPLGHQLLCSGTSSPPFKVLCEHFYTLPQWQRLIRKLGKREIRWLFFWHFSSVLWVLFCFSWSTAWLYPGSIHGIHERHSANKKPLLKHCFTHGNTLNSNFLIGHFGL